MFFSNITDHMNIILIGCNTSDSSIWDCFLRRFKKEDYNVHFLDLMDRNNSITIDTLAEEIYNNIHNTKNIILIGLGFSGHIFYRVADLLVKNNKNLIKLLVVDSPPVTKRIEPSIDVCEILLTSPIDELTIIETITSKGVVVCIAHNVMNINDSLPYLLQINFNMLWNRRIMLIEGSHLQSINTNPFGLFDCLELFIKY